MRLVKVEDAVGKALAHDYTCIDEGFKGAIKRRGERVSPQDVLSLKKCGHYFVYVYDEAGGEVSSGYINEEEAVFGLARAIVGDNIEIALKEEGKAALFAATTGLLLVNRGGLRKVNSEGVFMLITRKNGSYVTKGELVGIVDLVPLEIPEDYMEALKGKLAGDLPLIGVKPSRRPRVGIVVTGTEVVEGLRPDLASPVVVEKLREYNCAQGALVYARDEPDEIRARIEALLEDHDAVIVTGGMSVDPTDFTPHSIRSIADEVVAYGIPIKPTTMSMIAYKGEKAVVGVSSGIIYYPRENILDVVLPWISAGVKIPREYLIELGEGGLLPTFLEKYGRGRTR